MLANLYRDEPKPLPSPHEEAILPVARLVRDEWMHTVYRGPADTDNLTQETYEKRDEYRSLMLKEPAVSAAFWSRIASVMTLIPKVHAQDPDNPAEVEVANFVKDAIGAVEGGWPRVIGSFAAGGLLDGFSVCELVYDFPERGKWRNKRWVLKEIAPLDGRFIRFDIDSFKRVVGVRGLKANAGQVFGVDRFAIYSHQQLFNNPFGISQFRAAYRAAKMMESAIKLRIILLQNFTGPFVAFKSASPETRASAMRIVAHARSQGFLVCDKNDDFTVTNMASGSDSEFQSAMDDLRKEMYTAICWGYLPFVEGREGAELGNSTVQKSITELGTWRLATGIAEVINRDIVRPLVRANIADETINFPFVSLGGQNTGDKKAAGDVFEQAKRIGVTLSKKQIQRAMDLEEPNGPEDELKEMPTGGMAGAGNPFSGMPMGDDGGMPPDAGAPPPDGSPVPDGGAPMPEGDDATPAAPGQPQAVKPGGSVDLSRWNPRIGKTDTAEMDKAAMIAILDLQARAHRAGSPGRFQKAIDALRSMIGNHPAMHLALAGPPDQAFGWRPEPTRTGGIKAINTENPQYILYGEKAKQALNDHPDKPKVAQESHERYQGVLHAKSRAQELAAKMMNGGGGSSAEYKELAGHVQHLSVNEIYAVRKTLMGSFSNAHKRAEMVSALSTYALRQAGESVPDAMPGQPSFRAPKKGMTAGASAGGSAPPPAAPPTAPTAAPSSKGGVATNLLKDHLDASQGLTPAQWDHYHGAIDRATAKMPAAAHERIARNLQGATFHAKSASIGDALYKDAAEHSPDPAKFEDLKGQKIGVGYCTSKGTLHINGDLRPGAGEDRNPEQFGVGKYAPAHEVYAHALGRVIDGPNYEMSSSKEWGQAFNDEIAHGGAQYGTHPLSRFASMSPEQGFAEFSRLVYGSKVPAKEVAERFPQATAFFQKNGLLPGSEAPTAPMAKGAAPKLATVPASAVHPTVYTAPALSEAFDKKVVVAKDGSHVDTLKPLTEETPKPVEKKSPFGRDELKAKPPIRNFMVGVGNIATMQFDSNMQKRLYDVGSKQRQSMRGKEVKGGGSGMAAEIAMLAAASGRKPGEIRNLSSEVYDDVRKQMKGAKDGEHRDIVDNHDVHGEKAKPTQATNDAPAPVLPARTDPNPGEAIPAAPGASLDLNDHKALASAVHDAASQLPDMFGKAANGPRGDWDGHKVLIGDTFDQMKKSGKLPESATLDQFKDSLVKANAGGAVQLSRLDLPNIYDQRGGVGRWKPSEIQHVNGTFHAINVPGSKITPRVGQDAEPAMTDSPHAKNPVLDAEMAKPDAAKEPHEMTKAEYVANRAKVTRDALEEWNAAGNKGFPPSSGDGSIAERNKLAEAAGLNPGTPEFAKEGMGDMHRLRVRAALAAGKTVPPHVLADYPDLAAKGSTAPKAGPATPQQIRSTVHDTFDDLLREKHHTTGMVPLHEIRQAIADKHGPDAASHKVFDEHLKDLRREKKLRLISISDRSKATGQQLQDSVPGIGENFFYAEQGPNFGDLQAEAAQHRKASAAATAAPDAKPASPPFAPGTKETAESVLERVKASPNQPADRDWDTHAQQHGIEGDFTHVEIPTKTLTDNVFGGHLRRSNSVDQNAVDKKVSSGERNPVLITKEPGRGSLVVDGNHSLAAAMQAGDPTVQAIVSEKSPLHPKGEEAAPTEPKTRHEQNGWTPENHVKIAADSIDKLRGVDVDRVLDSAPPELLDTMADHIRTNRPDLKDTVDAVHTDIKRERKQATNKVNDDQQRMEQNAKDADAIPRVSNDDFANGDWDQAHAGLSSEAVAIKMALGMKGIDGREYGIREHSRGKWQMVSKPMGAGASTERPQSPDAIAETPEKAAVGGNESVRDSSANAAGADSTYTPPVGDRLFDLGEAKRLEPHHAAINGTLESAGWRFGDAVSPKGKLEDAHDELKNLDDHLSEKADNATAPHQGVHEPFGSLLDSHKEVLADIAKGEHDLGDYGTPEDRTGDAVSAFKDGIDRDGLHRITNGLATNGHLEDAQWASRHHDKLEGSLTKSIEQAVKARHAKAAAEASTPDEHGVSLTPKQREEVEKNGAHKAETETGDETYVVHPAHLDKAAKLAASLRSYIPAEKQRAEQYRPRTEARKRADSKWQQMERQASSIDEQIAKHRGESEPEAVAETAPAKEVSPSHVDAYRKANERVKQPGGAVGGTRMKQDIVGMVAKEHGVGNGEAEALLEGAASPKGGAAPAVESPMSEPDKVETGGSMHPDQLRQAMAAHPGMHIVNRVDDANYETYGPDGKLSKAGIPVGELEKELQGHLKQGHRVAVVEPTPKKSGFSPVAETPKAEAEPKAGNYAGGMEITLSSATGVGGKKYQLGRDGDTFTMRDQTGSTKPKRYTKEDLAKLESSGLLRVVTGRESTAEPVAETPKAETPAPVAQPEQAATTSGKPAHPLDITKDNVRGVWEQERDAIIKGDRKLSPNAAGSLAAARILNHVGEAAREFIGQTDEKVRQGKPVTDAEDERYIHANEARKNLHTELVNLSGYRPTQATDEHPEALKPISSMDNTPSLSLADKLKERTAGIDPDEVKAALASHAEKAAWHEKRTTALTDALEAAKKRKREVGSRQPEARNATKEVNKLQKEHDAAFEERGKHGNSDDLYKAKLQTMAMDETHPEFLRLAAASQHAGKAHPNTAAEITPAVRKHLAGTGHDPELAEAVAGELARSPLRTTTQGIDGIIKGEEVRAGHVKARAEAKAHIESLGLPEADVRNAMNQADGLWSDGLEKFKSSWSELADGRKAEVERQASAKAESEKRAEASKKADAEGEAYLASVKSGYPDANASPDAVQRAIRHVAGQAHEWHEDVQLPAGQSAKQAVNEIAKLSEQNGRWALSKTIAEKGWVSDTKYMMKASPEMVAHAVSIGADKTEGRSLPVDSVLPKKFDEYTDAKPIASQVSALTGLPRVLMQSGDRHMEFEPKYIANIQKHYPDAQWKMGKHSVVAVQNGEVVAMVMPFTANAESEEARPIATGKRLAISDVAEPGPFKAEDVKEVAGKLKVGEGTDMAATLQVMGGRDNQVYLKGAGTDDRMYGSAREAIAAGKEILAHSHGTDEDGNIIFKPKGAGTTELTGEAKTKRDYYAGLREKAKGKLKKSKHTLQLDEGKGGGEVDMQHVSENFGVHKPIPDANGKSYGYNVTHKPSSLSVGNFDKQDQAIQFAHALDNMPDTNWATVPIKDSDSEEFKSVFSKFRNVKQAFDEDAYHPDMGTFGKGDDTPGASPAIREPQDKPTPGGAEVAKEPHEMTKAESSKNAIEKMMAVVRGRMEPLGDKKSLEAMRKVEHIGPLAVADEAAHQAGHHLSKEEHKAIESAFTQHESHGKNVAAALAAGKPVPPHVLADYPDLAAKHGKGNPPPGDLGGASPALKGPTPKPGPTDAGANPARLAEIDSHVKSLDAYGKTEIGTRIENARQSFSDGINKHGEDSKEVADYIAKLHDRVNGDDMNSAAVAAAVLKWHEGASGNREIARQYAGANPTGNAGLPAELTPQVGGEAPQATPKKNPFREEHDKLQKRIESLTGQTSHDKAMENAFPFGTGRPGNASSQRTAKASAARIETTVNNAVKANELIKKRNELKAKADQFDSGIIDEHGRETPETLKARAEKQAVAKKGMDAVNDYMRETLKPGDTVYHSNGATVVKRVNPTGITTESGAKFKYDELAPKHSTEDRAMTTRELMDLAKSRAEAPPAPAPETESAPTAPAGYSLKDHESVEDRALSGEMNAEQFRAAYKHFRDHEPTLKAELAQQNVTALRKMASDMGGWPRPDDKKADLIDTIYDKMAGQLVPTGISYSYNPLKTTHIQHLDGVAAKVTDKDLSDRAERVKAQRAERAERVKTMMDAIKEPKTYEDFQTFAKLRGEHKMTPEQLATWDNLRADKRREGQKAKRLEDAKVTGFTPGESATGNIGIVEGHHKKRNAPTFTVTIEQHLGDNWGAALERAKRLGGSYVNGRIAKAYGATPGFQFFDRAKADEFAKVLRGETVDQTATVEQREADRIANRAGSLTEKAAAKVAEGQESLGKQRQENTHRRADMAASARAEAQSKIAHGRTLERIGQAMDAGELKHLNGVKGVTDLHSLNRALQNARYARYQTESKENPALRYEEFMGQPHSEDDVRTVTYPYPQIWSDDLRTMAKSFSDEPGLVRVADKLLKAGNAVNDIKFQTSAGGMKTNGGQLLTAKNFAESHQAKTYAHFLTDEKGEESGVRVHASYDFRLADNAKKQGIDHNGPFYTADKGQTWGVSPEASVAAAISKGKKLDLMPIPQEKLLTLADPDHIEAMRKAARRLRSHSNRDLKRIGENLHDKLEHHDRLKRADITNGAELRAALREYIPLRASSEKENPVKEMERKLVGQKIDGFFPTPRPLIERMLDKADIQPGHAVLEPSAGKGDILDAISERHPEANAEGIEPMSSLRSIIEAKGHKLAGHDVMEHSGEYDRVVMNPPFENGQDAQHVQKAYEMLKPGGRLVAVMSAGPFGRSDKKSEGFREWLDSMDHEADDLPDGSFAGSDAFRKTGVRTKLLTINKPA